MSSSMSITMMTNICRRQVLNPKWKMCQWFKSNTAVPVANLHRVSAACAAHTKSGRTPLNEQLEARIRMKGPLTVAEYMQEVLTSPADGYYMNKDVFGVSGDFITSPEISQMFGELIGVWCASQVLQSQETEVQLVELGPGRGTLSDDILRVFQQLKQIKAEVSLHLVEVSPTLSRIQQDKLCGSSSSVPSSSSDDQHPHAKISKYGPEVFWHKHLKSVPDKFSIFIAHEFFDALPIYSFKKQNDKWQEVMVDVDEDADSVHHLRFVMAPCATPASTLLLKVPPDDHRTHLELSPAGGVIVQEIASRLATDGGAALIADYGHTGEKEDTFRGFRQHKLHDPLCEPGTADLTADVDFSYLKQMVANKVVSYGPIKQREFLNNMGIIPRLQVLLKNAKEEKQKKDLMSGFEMLMHPEQMGDRFKFLAFLPQGKQDVPAGFVSLQTHQF